MDHEIFPAARRSLLEIWHYSEQHWGESQADKYIRGLHEAISKAAGDKGSWRVLGQPELRDLYYIRYEKHFIFFRLLTTGVLGVISILHEKMDIPNRLREDKAGK